MLWVIGFILDKCMVSIKNRNFVTIDIIHDIFATCKGYFMENKYFSISKFAEMANVSRQAIYRRIEKDLKNYIINENGVMKISKDALMFFDNSNSSLVRANTSEIMTLYNEQIAKNEELHKTEIALLSSLVRANSEKTAKIDNLMDTIKELNKTIESMQKTIVNISDKRKPFFKRLFSRKGGDK